ncbi:hypothetical protein ABIF65_001413 [Bradyrhizobium japonicum]|nr:hypothetical protein [Bradyrhizobium japonicum]MCP1778127.1 hypothetical protein [Bradyrhizobium japonicum]MCP1857618.1 hypothetical protein [Bradyrhizobium japonicum]MCP1888432.1 hypothetical protein [Bradyrhizobium japonicum]MCP1958876.1 hypothetical protein [Bradyrhizobium japonicum]
MTEPDHGEVADGIERQFCVKRGRSGLADMHQEQRVAIRRGLGDAVGAECAAGTDDILDDDGLLQRRAHGVAENSRDDVAGAAGGERHDHRDRAGGVVVCDCRATGQEQETQDQRSYQRQHRTLPEFLFF